MLPTGERLLLAVHHGPRSTRALAGLLRVDVATVHRMLAHYEREGMLARERGPRDRADQWRLAKGVRGRFCEGARECWVEVERATGRVARYRSVEGEDHTLLVLDLDGHDGALQTAWEAARAPWAAGPWWLLKFSGSRGFHMVAKLPGAVAPAELHALARRRVEAAGVDPGVVDWSIYTRRRLIRCVGSLHLGSGMRSVVVQPWKKTAGLVRASAEGSSRRDGQGPAHPGAPRDDPPGCRGPPGTA